MTKLLKLPKSETFAETAAASIDASAVRVRLLMVTVVPRNILRYNMSLYCPKSHTNFCSLRSNQFRSTQNIGFYFKATQKITNK